MNWTFKKFDDLNAAELYDILKLRQDVFIIEQDCIYPDMDESDSKALHLFSYDEIGMSAYLRLFEPGIKFEEASIGRIVIPLRLRGTGIGNKLVAKGIEMVEKGEYTKSDIRIEAQSHLEAFYTSLGFVTVSDAYMVDGIEHLQMIRKSG